jgi:hypothetical protein
VHHQSDDTPHELVGSIIHSYPDAATCAQRVTLLIQLGLRATVTADETAFIALHVTRLVGDARGLQTAPDGQPQPPRRQHSTCADPPQRTASARRRKRHQLINQRCPNNEAPQGGRSLIAGRAA